MIERKGALASVKQMIGKKGASKGFENLYKKKRLDLSIEFQVLKPEYEQLFTQEEREICWERLSGANYDLGGCENE